MAFGCFLSFNHTNIIGGCQHDTRGLLGVGGHPSSQMQRIMHIIEIMFKMHFSRL